jgi:hypothetical protein
MDVLLAILLLTTAVVTAAYWIDFFVHGSVNVVDADWYIKFERAFPVADGFMSACCALAGAGLLTDWSLADPFALVAAGALLFLGLMDITFNVDNRLYGYVRTSWPMRAELVINVWCIGFGALLLAVMLSRAA